MHYEQKYVKYKRSNRRYIHFSFISFSDLQLSFWFESRYFQTSFCKMYLKGTPFEVFKNVIGIVI